MAVVYAPMRSSSVDVGQRFKHRSTFYMSPISFHFPVTLVATVSNITSHSSIALKYLFISATAFWSMSSCYQHVKWYIKLLGVAQEVGRRLHIPGVRSQSEGISMRDSWWTKWQYNRFLIRVLLLLPVTNSELTLLVAREDFVKQVSPTIWSLSFPLSRFLCFTHIIPYIRFYVVSFSIL